MLTLTDASVDEHNNDLKDLWITFYGAKISEISRFPTEYEPGLTLGVILRNFLGYFRVLDNFYVFG